MIKANFLFACFLFGLNMSLYLNLPDYPIFLALAFVNAATIISLHKRVYKK